MTYKRNETAFFHMEETKRAIVELASCDRLIIYCGAGVTIDRTGLAWGDLIAQLFDTSDRSQSMRDPTAEELLILRKELTPLQLASVLAERTEEHHNTQKEARASLVPKLQQALYKGSGWQCGALVSNIIRLSFGLVQLGKSVSIITSNYDTYLEEEYAHYRGELRSNPQLRRSGAGDIAGLVAKAVGARRTFRDIKSDGNADRIDITYLHGRVPPAGGMGGYLALSEKDYHRVSDTVVGALRDAFSAPRTGVLMLGTSLTDPPLLRALSETRPDHGNSASEGRRIALVPATSTGFTSSSADFGRLVQNLKVRAIHFGVELLVPDFHFQIAQMCQEILTAVSLPSGVKHYLVASSSARYGIRLGHWWSTWQEQQDRLGPEHVHDALAGRLAMIRELLAADDNAHDPRGELMKVELWARHAPNELRHLALWGGSGGVLRDRSILHFEELDINTRNASVRAFIEGRPQYLSQEELADNQEIPPGRWNSFLSVPIRIDLPDGTVPVGVITLASMRDKNSSVIPDGSVRGMTSLVNQLTAVGQELLQVS